MFQLIDVSGTLERRDSISERQMHREKRREAAKNDLHRLVCLFEFTFRVECFLLFKNLVMIFSFLSFYFDYPSFFLLFVFAL